MHPTTNTAQPKPSSHAIADQSAVHNTAMLDCTADPGNIWGSLPAAKTGNAEPKTQVI
jgi:hypothetical protein